MKKRNKIIIAVVIIIIILMGIYMLTSKSRNNEETIKEAKSKNETEQNEINTINEIKSKINATADTDMYQIEEEYDGRKIIQIKPSIQFQTVLAGILKKDIPAETEIENQLKRTPTKHGIWISSNSKDRFIEILKANNINSYEIDDDGYLGLKEKQSIKNAQKADSNIIEKLNNMIASDKLFIIDISGRCFVRDDISGEIIEYPFERMDPYQVLEVYRDDNITILEITKNLKQKLSDQEILETILLNMK